MSVITISMKYKFFIIILFVISLSFPVNAIPEGYLQVGQLSVSDSQIKVIEASYIYSKYTVIDNYGFERTDYELQLQFKYQMTISGSDKLISETNFSKSIRSDVNGWGPIQRDAPYEEVVNWEAVSSDKSMTHTFQKKDKSEDSLTIQLHSTFSLTRNSDFAPLNFTISIGIKDGVNTTMSVIDEVNHGEIQYDAYIDTERAVLAFHSLSLITVFTILLISTRVKIQILPNLY